MNANPIKVRVKVDFTHPLLKQWLPLGFETEVIPVLRDEKSLLVRETKSKDGKVVSPEVWAEKGTYLTSKIRTADGQLMDDSTLRNFIGYKKYEEIFDKI